VWGLVEGKKENPGRREGRRGERWEGGEKWSSKEKKKKNRECARIDTMYEGRGNVIRGINRKCLYCRVAAGGKCTARRRRKRQSETVKGYGSGAVYGEKKQEIRRNRGHAGLKKEAWEKWFRKDCYRKKKEGCW